MSKINEKRKTVCCFCEAQTGAPGWQGGQGESDTTAYKVQTDLSVQDEARP